MTYEHVAAVIAGGSASEEPLSARWAAATGDRPTSELPAPDEVAVFDVASGVLLVSSTEHRSVTTSRGRADR